MIRLDATTSALTVAAFDYETSAQATVEAEITTPGTVLVSGRLLAGITRAIKGTHPVDLELDGARLILTSGRTCYTLHTLPLEEYPTSPAPRRPAGPSPARPSPKRSTRPPPPPAATTPSRS